MDEVLTIQEKFLLLGNFRCYLEARQLVEQSADLVRFDEIYLETVSQLAERLRGGLLEAYAHCKELTPELVVDLFRLQKRYLDEQYNLLLFELMSLGFQRLEIEETILEFNEIVFGYFIILRVVDARYAHIRELILLPVYVFLAAIKGSLKERFDILMGKISLTGLYEVYLNYINMD